MPGPSKKEVKADNKGTKQTLIAPLPLNSIAPKQKQLPLLTNYFEVLFNINAAETQQLIKALIQDEANFVWGVQVLNAASGTTTKQIAGTLIETLEKPTLLKVFQVLFKMEQPDTWGRGNQLLPQLIQYYLESSEEAKKFSQHVLTEVFSLQAYLHLITLIKSEDSFGLPESYSATEENVTLFSEILLKKLTSAFAPEYFPDLVYQILQISRLALVDKVSDKTEINQILLSMLLLRFINPMITNKAQDLSDKNAQTWFTNVIASVIQKINLNGVVKNPKVRIGSIEYLKDSLLAALKDLGMNLWIQIEKSLDDIQIESVEQPIYPLDSTVIQTLDFQIAEQFPNLKVEGDDCFTPRKSNQHAKVTSGIFKQPETKVSKPGPSEKHDESSHVRMPANFLGGKVSATLKGSNSPSPSLTTPPSNSHG